MHPSASSSPASGIQTTAESDLKKSLSRSSWFWTSKTILRPFWEISPPVLISLFLYPQNSHTKEIRTMLLKKGTEHSQVLISPFFPHWTHSYWNSITCCWNSFSSNALASSGFTEETLPVFCIFSTILDTS